MDLKEIIFMPGVTKHIYNRDIIDINIMWNAQLKEIEKILPCKYDGNDILLLLKEYYPHEWKSVEYKKLYYDTKDKFLIRRFGKARYKMPCAEKLLQKNAKYNYLLSDKARNNHGNSFDEYVCKSNTDALFEKRQKKICRIDTKIEKAKSKTQTVTPVFLDKLMGLYDRKNTSQKDKVYIINELMKYYNPKLIAFFFKINDTELNIQLREIAFKHLQSFNYEPRLRRQKYMQVHTKNKKRKEYLEKVYPKEIYQIPHNPDELEYRIQNGKEQQIKTHDYFISHSSRDSKLVQSIINYENSIGKNVFCDWINESDYLKRNLVCESTLKVIEWRLQQSDAVIFVRTENSLESVWCKYELNYFMELNKPIYYLDKDSAENGDFTLYKYDNEKFIDPNYKQFFAYANQMGINSGE